MYVALAAAFEAACVLFTSLHSALPLALLFTTSTTSSSFALTCAADGGCNEKPVTRNDVYLVSCSKLILGVHSIVPVSESWPSRRRSAGSTRTEQTGAFGSW